MPLQLVGQDNFIEFLRGRGDVRRCPGCNVPTHPFDHGFPQAEVPKNFELSNCFEGFELASPRLKEFLANTCTSPLSFFETGGGYFVIRPERFVFEALHPGSNTPGEFYMPPCADEFCGTCGRYNAFHATPIGILPGQQPVGPYDLVRSALQYGPVFQKNFFLIAGEGLVAEMKDKNFNGATYVPYSSAT